MSAFVTDQFRILNAASFVESISNNSYYAFLGLSNPSPASTGFGRLDDWNTSTTNNPIDNFQYLSHYRDTSLFGKKITSENARRVIRKVEWVANTPYDMYRNDYRQGNQSPVSKTVRLYDANYYVVTSEFKVYICIDNGSSGTNPTVTGSTIEPTQTDVEPSVAGSDGYRWKYLFSISPSDVIKFDSTEYITVPNDWLTTTDPSIQTIREGGNSDNNNNQIKTVYIEDGGTGYSTGTTADIVGDGSGGKVTITTDSSGTITDVVVTNGGKGYTYGIINLSPSSPSDTAKLIPIIPPSKGHGYNIYEELGTDKVLMYARFDDSTKDFPIDTKFAQVGIIKNPETFSGAGVIFTENTFSSLFSIVLTESRDVTIGEKITQSVSGAKGYVASFDKDTKILKYYQDRSLCYGNKEDQTLSASTTNTIAFDSTNDIEFNSSGGSSSIDNFSGSVLVVNDKQINLGVTFTNGLADPEINKKTGDIIYIDNRPEVQRDSRQKEDIKIILEF
jgi:hypothetical protein|tara:strand:- start:69 stop:1580 length:1512 start_codon:yes stop_codon:yes gene_type:complete